MPVERVSLSRSCRGCIKAKRRCDLARPICGRCSGRNLRCAYSHEPAVEALTPNIRHFPLRWLAADESLDRSRNIDEGDGMNDLSVPFAENSYDRRQLTEEPTADMSSWQDLAYVSVKDIVSSSAVSSLGIHFTRPSFYPVTLTVDRNTNDFICRLLRPAVGGPALYIHSALADTLPRPAAASKMMKLLDISPPCNHIWNSNDAVMHCDSSTDELESATRELIAYVHRAGKSINIVTLLVCVQTLLRAEIALAFGEFSHDVTDSSVYARRSRQFKVLSRWCWTLWEQAPWTLPGSSDSVHNAEQNWIFAESVRRTLLVAHIACDTFVIPYTGVFKFSGFVSTLPYDSRTWRWMTRAQLEHDGAEDGVVEEMSGSNRPGGDLTASGLQSFRQLILKFEDGHVSAGNVDDFETLLLVACRGYHTIATHFGWVVQN